MYCKCSIESVKVNGDVLEIEFLPVGSYCIENREKFYALFTEKEEDMNGDAKLISYEIDKKLKAIFNKVTETANVICASMLLAAKTGGVRVLLNVDVSKTPIEVIGVSLI